MLASENSPNIWEKIKKLHCPPKKTPLEVFRSDGTVTTNHSEVIERWFDDISKLFSGIRENPDVVY